MADDAAQPPSRPYSWALSASVFAERDGKILLLKRALGEASGAWYIPGGAVEPGEEVEDAARRELFEESGLVPSGELRLVAAHHMFSYGREALQLCYAADCADGEIVLSDEHSAARWIDPVEYRERYFRDDIIAQVEQADAHLAQLIRSVRKGLDAYIASRSRQRRTVMSVDVYLVRDDRMLVLQRASGRGRGFWMCAGGDIDPGEHPLDAALRETLEETGLRIEHAQLMHIYRDFRGSDIFRAAYVAHAPADDVIISDEHTAHEWLTPDEYVERYCSERAGEATPEYAEFFRQLRENCARVKAWIAAQA